MKLKRFLYVILFFIFSLTWGGIGCTEKEVQIPSSLDSSSPPIELKASSVESNLLIVGEGENLKIQVTFPQAVIVVGYPYLQLNISDSIVYATYQSGSGSSILTFSYQVVEGDFDDNGISVLSLLDETEGHLTSLGGRIYSVELPQVNIQTRVDSTTKIVTVDQFEVDVTENGGTQSLNFKLNASTLTPIVVEYSIIGSAIQGTDYSNPQTGSFTFTASSTQATVNFTPIDDGLTNNPRYAVISLNKVTSGEARIGDNSYSIIYFSDDESNLGNIIDVKVGTNFVCALFDNNKIYCWGSNAEGQIGKGDRIFQDGLYEVSGTYKSLLGMVGLSVCAIGTDDKLYCWGDGALGRLGNNSSTSDRLSPATTDGSNTYLQGRRLSSSCAITSSNDLKCWGTNSSYQLGLGDTTHRLVATTVDSPTKYSYVGAAGYDSTCAIQQSNSKLKCWGNNTRGAVGKGDTIPQTTPLEIDSSHTYQKVDSGNYNTCGITTSGDLRCWGLGTAYRVGHGSENNQLTPVSIDPGTQYKDVFVSDLSCGLTIDDHLKCWGYNQYLGLNGVKANFPTPTPVFPDKTFLSASIPSYSFGCFVTTDFELICWGENSSNLMLTHFGDNQSAEKSLPTPIALGHKFLQLDIGSNSACGVSLTNELYCWGTNDKGQLGVSYPNFRHFPVHVDALETYSYVSVGTQVACGITTGNQLKCWGSNTSKMLGYLTSSTFSSSPTVIDSGTGYSKIYVGDKSACAITTTGVLKCWGDNNQGQLGLGSPTESVDTPMVVDSGTSYVRISLFYNHACGVTSSQKVRCWGWNGYGQLGDTTSVNKFVPTEIDAANDYTAVSTGMSFSCAITLAGLLRCWGENYYNQLGFPNLNPTSAPTDADDVATIYSTNLTSNWSQSCALTNTNKIKCWGYQSSSNFLTDEYNKPGFHDATTDYKFVTNNSNITCGIDLSDEVYCTGTFNGVAGLPIYRDQFLNVRYK